MSLTSYLSDCDAAPVGLLVVALFLLAPAVGSAQTAGFRYKVKSGVEKGKEKPAVILEATGDIASSKIHLKRSDGEQFTKSLGALSAGQKKVVPVDQPAGTYSYEITLTGTGADDEKIDTTFTADMTVVDELKVWVKKNRALVAQGKLKIKANRPISKVDLEVLDSDGGRLHSGTVDVGGRTGPFEVEWPANDEVGAVRIKAHDTNGFWRALVLEPFWVKIPHEEVRFEFGTSDWDKSEVPKLKDSIEKIRAAMKKHGSKGLTLRLYVAGYTDTVGSKSSNRTLSQKRARAIGKWFATQNLGIPIYYQGFGEDALAVETPDETKNKKNRRAIYILGNARPPTSEAIPRSNWKRLQ